MEFIDSDGMDGELVDLNVKNDALLLEMATSRIVLNDVEQYSRIAIETTKIDESRSQRDIYTPSVSISRSSDVKVAP